MHRAWSTATVASVANQVGEFAGHAHAIQSSVKREHDLRSAQTATASARGPHLCHTAVRQHRSDRRQLPLHALRRAAHGLADVLQGPGTDRDVLPVQRHVEPALRIDDDDLLLAQGGCKHLLRRQAPAQSTRGRLDEADEVGR